MARNAIVRLCTLLVLVLLVSAASSGWASPKGKSSYQANDKKGAMCGGIAGLTCPEGQACRYPTNMCNVADLAGTCVKVKSPCPTGGAQVCGCDGKTYANECELLTAGARQASKGACKPAA